MKVWIMVYEHGEYSDYSMGILGAYADPGLAKQDVESKLRGRYNLDWERFNMPPREVTCRLTSEWTVDENLRYHAMVEIDDNHWPERGDLTIMPLDLQGAV